MIDGEEQTEYTIENIDEMVEYASKEQYQKSLVSESKDTKYSSSDSSSFDSDDKKDKKHLRGGSGCGL